MWNPEQYLRYADQRARAFFDLLAHVPERPYRRIIDLGCGPGTLTKVLAERWPEALVTGVDNSPEMLAQTGEVRIPGRLEFQLADIAKWNPPGAVDLILTNAALQWVGDHDALLNRLVAALTHGGVLAVQMPVIGDMPARREIAEVVRSGPWRSALEGVGLQADAVKPLGSYAERLLQLGCAVDGWETTYQHVLTGEDPVLEWMKGTALRPLLAQLGPDEQKEFLRELGGRLRLSYPPVAGRTLFPFPRLFFVAERAGAGSA